MSSPPNTTPAKTIAMDDTDKEAAVAMAPVTVVEVQAAAEPVVVGLDISNPERAGHTIISREPRRRTLTSTWVSALQT